MKKTLAILNFLASIPVIAAVIGLCYIFISPQPANENARLGMIGGSRRPTDIILTCQLEPLSILIAGIYAGLLLWNGVFIWKIQSTKRLTEPRVRGPVA